MNSTEDAQPRRPDALTREQVEDYADAHTTAWPVNAMAYYLSGVLNGIDLGREQSDAEADASFRRAARIVQAHASLAPNDTHRDAVRARQVAACEAHQRLIDPWSYEGPPLPTGPSGHAVDPDSWGHTTSP